VALYGKVPLLSPFIHLKSLNKSIQLSFILQSHTSFAASPYSFELIPDRREK
jgi:hypothetical protein